jgi:thiamine pyrophosphate-dependent acetolactate synthase large subunit-like protein
MTMTILDACKVLDALREDSIVVCTMGSMNALDQLPPRPMTIACVPLMGGAASLGLGLALAQPHRRVFVLDGDASLLMELGGLVSVAHAAPSNYFHFLFDNGVQFAGLGNLATPGQQSTDFVGLAKAAGYRTAHRLTSLETLQEDLAKILEGPSPAMIQLVVGYDKPLLGSAHPSIEMTDARFTRMGDELRKTRAYLGITA